MRLLLAYDSSSHAEGAADFLHKIPFRRPVDLNLISVVTPPIMVDAGGFGMPVDLSTFLGEETEQTRTAIDAAAASLREQLPVRAIHTHIPVGPAATEILSVAEDTKSDLIVLGALGHSAMQRVLLGSVSDYVATHADTSTLIVRPHAQANVELELQKIVIALSGQPEDARMLRWLRAWKLRPHVEVHLVRVMPLHTFFRQDIRQRASGYWDEQMEFARKQILEFETQVQASDLSSETHLIEADHIGEALIEYADQHGCDLIMTGDSDSGLLTRVFLGSTSRYVVRHAHCSVLIARNDAEMTIDK